MTIRSSINETQGFGLSFIASTVTHLAVFLLLVWGGSLFQFAPPVQRTYYVDIVSLPVASPQAGSPAPEEKSPDAVSTSPPVPVMKVPTGGSPGQKASRPAMNDGASFAEKISSLQSKAEAQHQEAALDAIRRRASATKTGMPGAKGQSPGSDYTAYIHSRLKDAFKETISYNSKSPEMVVRIVIEPDGRLGRTLTEKSSGDRIFDLSVTRAISMAAENFTPPPSGKTYEGAFVFRPQGIKSQTNAKK